MTRESRRLIAILLACCAAFTVPLLATEPVLLESEDATTHINFRTLHDAAGGDTYVAMQRLAVLLQEPGPKLVTFPPGVYHLARIRTVDNGVQNVVFEGCSNFTLSGRGATITVEPPTKTLWRENGTIKIPREKQLSALCFDGCSDFVVEGFEVDGNGEHITGQFVGRDEYGLTTHACKRYAIRDVYVHDYGVDGLCLGQGGGGSTASDTDVTLERVRSQRNGRQGLTLVQVTRARITDCEFTDNGWLPVNYAPRAGCDIEPHFSRKYARRGADGSLHRAETQPGDIHFKGCTFSGNRGKQFVASLATHVLLEDCVLDGTGSESEQSAGNGSCERFIMRRCKVTGTFLLTNDIQRNFAFVGDHREKISGVTEDCHFTGVLRARSIYPRGIRNCVVVGKLDVSAGAVVNGRRVP